MGDSITGKNAHAVIGPRIDEVIERGNAGSAGIGDADAVTGDDVTVTGEDVTVMGDAGTGGADAVTGQGGGRQPTGDRAVDEALGQLDALTDQPLDQQIDAGERVYRVLQGRLADLGQE